MEAMRASPRASGARRVFARKRGRPDDASANSARKLQRREVAAGPGRAFSQSFRRERFRNIQLQEEFDTHDPLEKSFFLLPSLRAQSAVREIFGAQDIIFALSYSGVCAALSRVTKQRVCFLNGSPDEVIVSLFYNKANESIITVSAYASEDLHNLFCRTTPIECIRQAMPGAGLPLFEEEELLNGKSFVQVDDVNGKVLIYWAQDSIYKVFDWKTYALLYTISDKNIWKIKLCPGILVLIYRKEGYVSLEVRSIEDNKSLRSLKHLLHRSKPVEFIEQFDEKFFIKQKGEDLQILDIRDSSFAKVSRKEFVNPTSVIFLQRLQMFLTFHGRSMSVWNYRGERVTCFVDHVLWCPKCPESVSITGNQDIIVSYCRADPNDPSSDGNACSINISEMLTGKCLAKIKAGDLCKQKKALKFQKTPAEALRDITALYYDEEHEEIYTGNAEGLVHMWSS